MSGWRVLKSGKLWLDNRLIADVADNNTIPSLKDQEKMPGKRKGYGMVS